MWDNSFPNGNTPKSMNVFCHFCVPEQYADYFIIYRACPRRDLSAKPNYLGQSISGTNDPCGMQLHLAHTGGLRG